MKPLTNISEEIENMRTLDINTDSNSIAAKALRGAVAQSAEGFAHRSTRRLSGLFQSPASAKAPQEDEEERDPESRKVEGRSIEQVMLVS